MLVFWKKKHISRRILQFNYTVFTLAGSLVASNSLIRREKSFSRESVSTLFIISIYAPSSPRSNSVVIWVRRINLPRQDMRRWLDVVQIETVMEFIREIRFYLILKRERNKFSFVMFFFVLLRVSLGLYWGRKGFANWYST